MFLRTHIPGPPLDEYIDRFWYCSDTPVHAPERILPSGAADLIINLTSDEIRIFDGSDPVTPRRYPGAVVSGPYSKHIMVDPLPRASLLGLHFRPGRAASILGVPVIELADAHVPLETLWGRTAVELRERLSAATTSAQRFAILEDALLKRLRQASPRHGAMPIALNAFERVDAAEKIRDLARRVGLSQRHFIQLFTAEVGLTPKLYSRVRRFQRARELVRDIAEPEWAAIALACGFFDQSHMIRDFGEFSGLSPVAYVGQRTRHAMLKHMPWVG
jgi:AraC-like DNA-binding protein